MAIFHASDGVPIAYRDTGGTKQPLVFVHGWTSEASNWTATILGLRRDYRCIALDLRGHGRTPAQGEITIPQLARDVHGLIEHLGLERPIIVGWSMGGLTTMEYLRQFGDAHLRGVVLVDQSPRMQISDDWTFGLFGTYSPAHLALLDELFTIDHRRVIRKFSMGILHPKRRVLRFLSWLTARYRVRADRQALLALAHNMADSNYCDLLPSVKVPTLLCYGSASWLYPGAVGEYMCQQLPNAQLVMFEHSGHCPPIEEPRKFVQTVREFCRSLDQQPARSAVA